MVFVTHPCEYELTVSGSANRSGIGKTSAGAVRNLLPYGHRRALAVPRVCQAARSGLVTSSANQLYRAGRQ